MHKQLAEKTFYHLNILSPQKVQEVAWKQVHDALCEAPLLLQVFACKQVNNVAGVNVNLARYTPHQDTASPSCGQEVESCHHILHCEGEGSVAALNYTIALLNSWLKKVGINNSLRQCLVKYARVRGGGSMVHVVRGEGARFGKLAQSVDSIGWCRHMEGMVSAEILKIQRTLLILAGARCRWIFGLKV